MEIKDYISNDLDWQLACREDGRTNLLFLPLLRWYKIDERDWTDWSPSFCNNTPYGCIGSVTARLSYIQFDYYDTTFGIDRSFALNFERYNFMFDPEKKMQNRLRFSLKPGQYKVTVKAHHLSGVKTKKVIDTEVLHSLNVTVPAQGDLILSLLIEERYNFEYGKQYNWVVDRWQDYQQVHERGVRSAFTLLTPAQAGSLYKWWDSSHRLTHILPPSVKQVDQAPHSYVAEQTPPQGDAHRISENDRIETAPAAKSAPKPDDGPKDGWDIPLEELLKRQRRPVRYASNTPPAEAASAKSEPPAEEAPREHPQTPKRKTRAQSLGEKLEKEGWIFEKPIFDVLILKGASPSLLKPSMRIPEGVAVLKHSFFEGEAGKTVRQVTLPSSVSWLPYDTFRDCAYLESVDLSRTKMKQLEAGSFVNCPRLSHLLLPDALKKVGENCFDGSPALSTLTRSDGKQLDARAIGSAGVKSTKEWQKALRTDASAQADPVRPRTYTPPPVTARYIARPKSIKSHFFIGLKLYNRSKLQRITLKPSVKELRRAMFTYCTELCEVDLSQTQITKIPSSAFSYCLNLKRIILPPTVTEIGNFAFDNCVRLESISLPNVTALGESAFKGCQSLTELSFPKLQSIQSKAFKECYRLKKLSLPKLTAVADKAFFSCGSLTSLDVPAVTVVKEQAFCDCVSLTELRLPSTRENDVRKKAFKGCRPELKLYLKGAEKHIFIYERFD